MRCPSAGNTEATVASKIDYLYNEGLHVAKESRIEATAVTVLNAEAARGVASSGSVASAPTRHFDGSNYSFVDGHVKWLKPAAVIATASTTQPTFDVPISAGAAAAIVAGNSATATAISAAASAAATATASAIPVDSGTLPPYFSLNDPYYITNPPPGDTGFWEPVANGGSGGAGGTASSPFFVYSSAETPRDFIAYYVTPGTGSIPAGKTYTFKWGDGPATTFTDDGKFTQKAQLGTGHTSGNWVMFNYKSLGKGNCVTFSIPLRMTSNDTAYPSYTRIYYFKGSTPGGGACTTLTPG